MITHKALGRVAAILVLVSCSAPLEPVTTPDATAAVTPTASPATIPSAVLTTSGPSAAALSPSATPAASPAGPASTALPQAAGVLDERHGFLVVDLQSGQLVVRSETSDARVASFEGREHRVSADGRWIAYWHPGEGSTLDRLYVALTSGGSPTRSMMTVQGGQRGGPIAWSSDGAGLLVAVNSGQFAARNDRSELWTVDVATTATQLLFTTGNGESWYPLGWDRAGSVAGAGVVESGFLDDYAVITLSGQRPALSTVSFRSFEMVITRVRASSDAGYVAGVGRANAVHWWPLAQPLERQQVQREGHASGLAWKPGTTQMGWVGGPIWSGCTQICGGSEIVLVDAASGRRTTAARLAFNTSLLHFRSDGSAAMLAGQGIGDLTVMELATGRTVDLTERGPFTFSLRLR